MSRLTDSRRARNSASEITGRRRWPSRESRRRWRLAWSLVEPCNWSSLLPPPELPPELEEDDEEREPLPLRLRRRLRDVPEPSPSSDEESSPDGESPEPESLESESPEPESSLFDESPSLSLSSPSVRFLPRPRPPRRLRRLAAAPSSSPSSADESGPLLPESWASTSLSFGWSASFEWPASFDWPLSLEAAGAFLARVGLGLLSPASSLASELAFVLESLALALLVFFATGVDFATWLGFSAAEGGPAGADARRGARFAGVSGACWGAWKMSAFGALVLSSLTAGTSQRQGRPHSAPASSSVATLGDGSLMVATDEDAGAE